MYSSFQKKAGLLCLRRPGHYGSGRWPLFGGSPTNICFKFNRKNIEIITGVNLPGVLKFLTHRERGLPFKKFIQAVKKEAIDGINVISEYLGEKEK